MDFNMNEKYLFEECLYEEGQYLSFVRDNLNISMNELSDNSSIPVDTLKEFEDGIITYLDDFNTIHSKYLDSLKHLAEQKGINYLEIIKKYENVAIELE